VENCIRIIESVEELGKNILVWMSLLNVVVDDNIFYKPCFFIPSFRYINKESVVVSLIFSEMKEGEQYFYMGTKYV